MPSQALSERLGVFLAHILGFACHNNVRGLSLLSMHILMIDALIFAFFSICSLFT